MDAIRMHLNWLANNSRNLSETQKEEIYGLLNSLKNHLENGMGASGSANVDEQLHKLSKIISRIKVPNEKTCHEIENKIDSKDASLESKINDVTNIVSKEAGYIHGKLDTIEKNYNKQLKMLKDEIEKLKNDNNQNQQAGKKVKNEDIDQLTKDLKDLMSGFDSESCIKTPNSNPIHSKGPPPPYEPYPSMVPNQNMPYCPPCPPQFFPMPGPSSIVPPFQYNHPFSNYPPQPSCGPNVNVYQFSGNPNQGPSDNFVRSGGHQTPRFNKPFIRANNGKPDFDSKKKYCDPHWKKFDHRNKDHGTNKNEPSKIPNDKPYHKTPSRDKQSAGHDHFRSNNPNPVKNYADRGKHERYKQFGKNRSQNQDDGRDGDTSTSSHVSSDIPHQKTSHLGQSKTVASKSPDSSNTSSPSQKKGDNVGGDASKVIHHRKESDNKTGPKTNFKTSSTSKHSAQGTKQGDNSNSNLMKLNYPSKVEALKNKLDMNKRFELPSTCLGKKNGVPVSRVAHCLADIYRFEEEFGSCQVVRF